MCIKFKRFPKAPNGRILLCFLFAAQAHAGIFYNQACRMKVSFPGYDRNETLTNFPVLAVFHSGIENFNYDSFIDPAGGTDLRFSDSNMTDELNYEIEEWNTNGNSYIWVQVPALSSSNNCIWAFWGESSYKTPPACTSNGSTWSAGYAGVWHLGTNNIDSTSNRNNSNPSGNPANVSTAVIAGGMDLNLPTPTNYVSCNDSPSLNITGSVTVSTWIYWRSGRSLMAKEYQSNAGYAAEIDDGAGKIRWYTWGLDGFDIRSNDSFPKNGWHHLALVYDKENGRKNIYFDGILNTTTNASGNITTNTDPFYMGFSKLTGDVSYYYNGMLDEMRLSNVARSSNWLWACFMNQISNSSFNCYGRVMYPQGTVIIIR